MLETKDTHTHMRKKMLKQIYNKEILKNWFIFKNENVLVKTESI